MPVLTPQELQEISVRLGKLTQDFEDSVLEDISRRIAKTAGVTDTAEYQILRLKELGYANDFIEKQITDYTELSEKEIQQVFFDVAQVSDEFYSEVYQKAGKDFIPLAENEYVQQLLSAGIEQTSGELKNFTGSMGFSLPSPNGGVKFKPISEAYRETLDLAQFQVSTGVFDYNTAVRRAVKSLTDSGIRFVDYASGHVNRADVAARRAILTGVSQMTGKISLQNAAELETDIVEVTAHAGARPDHAEWQGGWYSLSGKSGKYRSLADATGYGTGAGLKGWNCRHDFYPVLESIDKPAYTEEELKNIDPPPIEYKGETLTYYECTQKQRKMETAIRKTKREIIGAKGSGDDEQFTVKSVLLRRQREEYNAFSKKANLLTQNERTQVYGFDRSTASKSSWAARKELDSLNSKKSENTGLTKISKSVSINTQSNIKTGSLLFTEENKIKMLQHERIISGNKYETAIIYNTDGSIAFQKKGNSNSVTFTPKEIRSMQGKTLTHNHPNESVHSPNDLNIMRRGKLSEIRACNSAGAYVIRCPDKWSYKLTSLDKIETAYNGCLDEAILKYKEIAAQNGENFLKYFDKAETEGLEIFCNRYNLSFTWEDKL